MKTGFSVMLVVGLLLEGCRTVPQLPPADLHSGWSVRQGQAIWNAAPDQKGVAGELLLATRPDGACYVQFAKPPFTLATARAEPPGWLIEWPAQNRRAGGGGVGPVRFVWFALAEEVRGRHAGGGWQFERRTPSNWSLTNALTGEVLEGYFVP